MYCDWINSTLLKKIESRLSEIQTNYNFELGDEFEVGVAKLLQGILPQNIGVCRGFIVTSSNAIAGDDIIIFDRSRFPTLRLLGGDLSVSENVPFEAVLAYIEVKHTLYLAGSEGSSLKKAYNQLSKVHNLPQREQISVRRITPNYSLDFDFLTFNKSPGCFDDLNNPLYCAIWARQVKMKEGDKNFIGKTLDCNAAIIEAIHSPLTNIPYNQMPSAIGAGNLLVLPIYNPKDGTDNQIRPFIGPEGVALQTFILKYSALAIAIVHLMWAVEQIQLGKLPWSYMIADAINDATVKE